MSAYTTDALKKQVRTLGKRADSIGKVTVKTETLELRALFEKYYASIWRLLRRLGVPNAQLDDATQEVFWVAARRSVRTSSPDAKAHFSTVWRCGSPRASCGG